MLKRVRLNAIVVNLIITFILVSMGWASPRYGETLCHETGFSCFKVKQGGSWATLFPDASQRDLLKRINRMNVFLQPGMVIAVPHHLKRVTLLDVAPFLHQIQSRGERIIVVDRQAMAFAAYDESGHLLKWGPASTGVTRCPDVDGGCLTPVGEYRVSRKQGEDCVSSIFPKRLEGGNGGAAMPYCMHFYKGYAIHGSDELSGRASSHGCINVFQNDAKWLNQQFVRASLKGQKGTLVVIK